MTDRKLPTTWCITHLDAVIEYGKTFKIESTGILPHTWVLELEDIERDTSRVVARLTQAQRQSKSTKNSFDTGDVLYGKLRPYLNKVVIADMPGCCTTEIIPLKVGAQLDNRYFFYWLKSPSFLAYVQDKSHGMNMPRLGTEAGKSAPFVLAPRNEQTRIADKLDALLARVDACRDHLDRIPDILKRFRQSVLAAATSGKLTEGWRDGMPMNWVEVKLHEVGDIGRGKSKHRPRNDSRLFNGPYPFIQTGDVANAKGLIQSHSQTYSDFGLAQSKLWPSGTLCITIAANIADTAILAYPACFPDSVVGFIADATKCKVEYIKWTIDVLKESLERMAPATAQRNINLGVLSIVSFALPSIEEQTEIVRQVELFFAIADRLEARYTAASAQLGNLPSTLLDRAFRGELVPHDPNDEPALELLKHLANERAKKIDTPTQIRSKRRTTPVKSKPIIPVVEALRVAPKALSTQALFAEAGYPSEAGTDLVERFFLDIRNELNGKRIERKRRGHDDYFSLTP